jgi:hypothetical protein
MPAVPGKTYQKPKNTRNIAIAIAALSARLFRISRPTRKRLREIPSIRGIRADSRRREARSMNRRETVPRSAIRWYAAGVMMSAMATATKSSAAKCNICSSPNKSQTTFITVIKNVMSWKEDFSRACNGEFLGVHDGFPAIAVRRSSFPL